MPLVTCPDCGTEVSDQAPACPKCGRPAALKKEEKKLDKGGAWCPHCGNRDSRRIRRVGCFFWVLVACTFGLALLLYPLLSQSWRCWICDHEWKA
jgi:DNA-directed RNA polymerase subunit RPC12/RpoP